MNIDMEHNAVSNIAVYSDEEHGNLRTVYIDGNIYFFLIDVCSAIEISIGQIKHYLISSSIVKCYMAEADKYEPRFNSTGSRLIDEMGLYNLLFRVRNTQVRPERIEKVRKYQEWVVKRVMPSVWHHAKDIAVPNFTDPVTMAREWAAQYEQLAASRKTVDSLQEDIDRLQDIVDDQQRTIDEQRELLDQWQLSLSSPRDWRAVQDIPWLAVYFADTSQEAKVRIEEALSWLSREAGIQERKIGCPEKGQKTVYHISVVHELRERLDNNPHLFSDIRNVG